MKLLILEQRPGVGKPQPIGQIWPVACFCIVCEPRMVPLFLKGYLKGKENYVIV